MVTTRHLARHEYAVSFSRYLPDFEVLLLLLLFGVKATRLLFSAFRTNCPRPTLLLSR